VNLLIDANLSPRIAVALHEAGYEVCHVVDVGLGSATDDQIVTWATEHNRVIQ
jgi:predicted nuclease of predicted toxin-antitoxin system